jgi:hypothetical protein
MSATREQSQLIVPLLGLLSQFVVWTALTTPPTPLRRASFFTTICLINFYMIGFTKSANPFSGYATGTTLMGRVVGAFDFIALTDAQAGLRPLGQRLPASRLGLRERAKWALELMLTPWGIGWNFQIPHVKPSKDETYGRRTFVLSRLTRALASFVTFDTVYAFSKLAGSDFGRGIMGPRLSPIIAMVASQLAWFTLTYAGMDLQHSIAAAVSIAIGVSSRANWPALNGSPRDAYTVGRFWSYVTDLFLHFFSTK